MSEAPLATDDHLEAVDAVRASLAERPFNERVAVLAQCLAEELKDEPLHPHSRAKIISEAVIAITCWVEGRPLPESAARS